MQVFVTFIQSTVSLLPPVMTAPTHGGKTGHLLGRRQSPHFFYFISSSPFLKKYIFFLFFFEFDFLHWVDRCSELVWK